MRENYDVLMALASAGRGSEAACMCIRASLCVAQGPPSPSQSWSPRSNTLKSRVSKPRGRLRNRRPQAASTQGPLSPSLRFFHWGSKSSSSSVVGNRGVRKREMAAQEPAPVPASLHTRGEAESGESSPVPPCPVHTARRRWPRRGPECQAARVPAAMEKGEEGEAVRITAQLLKAKTGEFDLESILLLKLRGLGITDLGCLGDCTNLEWLDLSGNAISYLGPLASLRALTVLNLSGNCLCSLEPLSACESLQTLNLAGNLVSSLQQLQCLAGLRQLENLRLRDPTGRLSNPVCASPAYRSALGEMFPGLKVIDGERVSGRGSEFYQLCKDLDNSLKRCAGGGGGAEPPGTAQPWVQEGYWAVRPPRRSSIIEEAYKQFHDVLQECRELGKKADDAIAQAERALSLRPDPSSFVF
ncbi:leucine-rich repeat-containing protein 61 isoform X4 [Alligator sinensis]|uniref:Leucine-rich repeat-containing protein 61 isoform X4 n=1 Tax=Alligator sinensis TaxID=38654 RepID=A0A3Q0FXY7_ALLSI|nr:leucine-rich repeat-containing protein 61 isoform X4 [Alligator sinensis]